MAAKGTLTLALYRLSPRRLMSMLHSPAEHTLLAVFRLQNPSGHEVVFNHAEPAGRSFADVFGFGFAGFGIVVQIREADFLEAAFRSVNHRADIRAGEVALAFRFAVVADDA